MNNTEAKRDEMDVNVAMPPADVFESIHVIESSMLNQGQIFNLLERVEFPPEGGIYKYFKGMPFPSKGFPFPEATFTNDNVKRITVTMLKTVATKWMALPLLAFAILPWPIKMKIMKNALENYGRITEWMMSMMFLKPDRYSYPARALRIALTAAFRTTGIIEDSWVNVVKTIVTMLEYDDAYRYRFQDIMTEASKEALLSRPIREVRRLIAITLKRDHAPAVRAHAKAIRFLATCMLLHPRIRRAFKAGISALTMQQFKWMQLDNADRYHVLMRGDYDFLGYEIKERQNMFVDFHTFSKCCRAGVQERKLKDIPFGGAEWETICAKCGKVCEWTQELPPQVEVSPNQKPK